MKQNKHLLKLHSLYSHLLIFYESSISSVIKKNDSCSTVHINSNLCTVLVTFIYKIRVLAISHCCMSIVQLNLLFNSSRNAVPLQLNPLVPLAALFFNNLNDVFVLHDVC